MVELADMLPAPEPVPEPEPPAPAPKPKPIPEPPKTNAPPKKVEAKKAEPKKAEPKKTEPKPKTLEERLAEVRKGGKTVKSTPVAKTQLDYTGLKSALNSVATGSGSGSGNGVYSPFAWYYAQVQQKMVQAWQQPTGAPKGITAEATIRVERDGTVSSKFITRRSGNPEFDQSVQSALNATTRLPVPPADLPSRDIEIEFVLSQ